MKKQILIVLSLCCMIICTSCVPLPKPRNTNAPSSINSSESSTSSEEVVEAEDVVLKKGELSTLDNWEITLNGFEIKDEISLGAISYSPDEGNSYLEVSFTIKNIGKESSVFLPTYSFGKSIRSLVYYQGEYEYVPSVLFGYDTDLHDDSLNPLTTISGSISFSIPSDIINSDELVIELSQGNKKVVYELK